MFSWHWCHPCWSCLPLASRCCRCTLPTPAAVVLAPCRATAQITTNDITPTAAAAAATAATAAAATHAAAAAAAVAATAATATH